MRFGGRHRPFKKPILVTSMERNLNRNASGPDRKYGGGYNRDRSYDNQKKNYHDNNNQYRNARDDSYATYKDYNKYSK